MQKIVTNLWFDKEAEEAAEFYVSIFKNAKIIRKSYYTASGPGPEGSVLTVDFQLEGQRFTAINGGPQFKFTPAISLLVDCKTQKEVDTLWRKLLAGGGEVQACGWLSDRYGLSWQICPGILADYVCDPDPAKVDAVMSAMMKMKKLDLAALQRAYRDAGGDPAKPGKAKAGRRKAGADGAGAKAGGRARKAAKRR